MTVKVIPSHSIKAFRYRVFCLGQDLWNARDPISRANLALQLADAATTLARMEVQVAQPFGSSSSYSLPEAGHS